LQSRLHLLDLLGFIRLLPGECSPLGGGRRELRIELESLLIFGL